VPYLPPYVRQSAISVQHDVPYRTAAMQITGEVKNSSLARQIKFAPKGAHVATLGDEQLLCGPRPKSSAGLLGAVRTDSS
jgi:hypothetical protein